MMPSRTPGILDNDWDSVSALKCPGRILIKMRHHLEKIYKPGSKLSLVGVFNLPGMDWHELTAFGADFGSANLLLEPMYNFDLTQIVREFTCISAASKSVLDLIFVNGSIGTPTDCRCWDLRL